MKDGLTEPERMGHVGASVPPQLEMEKAKQSLESLCNNVINVLD